MRVLSAIPLTLVPLLVYNAVVFWLNGGAPAPAMAAPFATTVLPSGAPLTITDGDALLALAVILLFLEILKATRTGTASLVDHGLSTAMLVAHIVEFLTVAAAGHAVFALLTVLSLVDVVAGFSITISGARRDIGYE